MKPGYISAAVFFVIGSSAGCSFGTAAIGSESERLPPGTAQLTMNGMDVGRSEAVQCAPNNHLTMITIGGESPVAVALISNSDEPAVESVKFYDLNGFTGSYNDGLGGQARVTIGGSTYQITGIARGFNIVNPSRPTTEEFEIEVIC